MKKGTASRTTWQSQREERWTCADSQIQKDNKKQMNICDFSVFVCHIP